RAGGGGKGGRGRGKDQAGRRHEVGHACNALRHPQATSSQRPPQTARSPTKHKGLGDHNVSYERTQYVGLRDRKYAYFPTTLVIVHSSATMGTSPDPTAGPARCGAPPSVTLANSTNLSLFPGVH